MAITMYDVSVPVFSQILNSVLGILDKTAEHIAAKKLDPAAILAARLFPDMFPFTRQIQSVSDHAKGATARLAAIEIPRFPDTEKTVDELKSRISRTLEFIGSVDRRAIEGSEDREITLGTGDRERTMKAQEYLLELALPNFFFHATTAYNILRHNGVELGKRHYLGR